MTQLPVASPPRIVQVSTGSAARSPPKIASCHARTSARSGAYTTFLSLSPIVPAFPQCRAGSRKFSSKVSSPFILFIARYIIWLQLRSTLSRLRFSSISLVITQVSICTLCTRRWLSIRYIEWVLAPLHFRSPPLSSSFLSPTSFCLSLFRPSAISSSRVILSGIPAHKSSVVYWINTNIDVCPPRGRSSIGYP